MSAELLKQFWALAALDSKSRITTASNMLEILSESQKDSEGLSGDVKYSLRRLVRGLSSSRQGARQGFALALAQVLKEVPEINLQDVLTVLIETTTVTGSAKGQDERDMLFGRLFGLIALYQSGRLHHDHSVFKQVLQETLSLAAKKSYLSEAAHTLLIDILSSSTPPKEGKDRITPAIESVVLPQVADVSLPEITPDQLMLALTLEARLSLPSATATNPPLWASGKSLLHHTRLGDLKAALFEAAVQAHPRVHSVWAMVLPSLLESSKRLRRFWTAIVDEGLAQGVAEKKYLALLLLGQVFASLSPSQVDSVLSPHLTTLLVKSAISNKLALHPAAMQTVKAMAAAAKSNPGLAIPAITQLAAHAPHTHLNTFLSLKQFQPLLQSMRAQDQTQFLTFLTKEFTCPEEDQREDAEEGDETRYMDNKRLSVVDQMFSLCRHAIKAAEGEEEGEGEGGKAEAAKEIVTAVLKILVASAMLISDARERVKGFASVLPATPSPAFSDSLQETCTQRLLNFVLEISTEDGTNWVEELNNTLSPLLKADAKKPGSVLVHSMDADALAARTAALKCLKSLEAASQKGAGGVSAKQAAALGDLMLYLSVAQAAAPTQENTDLLTDLVEVSRKLLKGEEKGESEADTIDILIEMVLALLLNSSKGTRRLISGVFNAFSGLLTISSIGLVTDVLTRSRKEEDEVYGLQSGGGDEEGSDIDSDEDVSDAEMGDEEMNGVEDAEKSEESASEAGEPMNGKELEDSEEEELPNEEEGRKYDQMLAATVKEIQERKTRERQMRQNIIHFKLRVCGLLGDFIKHHPSSPMVLHLIDPLKQAISACGETKHKRELKKQLSAVLQKLLSSKGHPEFVPAMKWKTTTMLKDFFKTARRTPANVKLATTGVIYTVQICKADAESMDLFGELFMEALGEFCTRHANTYPLAFFTTLTNRLGLHMLPFTGKVAQCLADSRTDYLRCDAAQAIVTPLLPHLHTLGSQHIPSAELANLSLSALAPVLEPEAVADKQKKTVLRVKAANKLVADIVRQAKKHGWVEALRATDSMSTLLQVAQRAAETETAAPAMHNAARHLTSLLQSLGSEEGKENGSGKRKVKSKASGSEEKPKKKRKVAK